MTSFDAAPCRGEHVLFDSTDPADHKRAKQFCDTCPIIQACRENLAGLMADAGYYGHPEGTWAGELIVDTNTRDTSRRLAQTARKERMAAEEKAFPDAEAKAAHHAYTRGSKSAWALMGHRVYQRRRKAAQRAAQKDAA